VTGGLEFAKRGKIGLRQAYSIEPVEQLPERPGCGAVCIAQDRMP
jgi:hypothetical protein